MQEEQTSKEEETRGEEKEGGEVGCKRGCAVTFQAGFRSAHAQRYNTLLVLTTGFAASACKDPQENMPTAGRPMRQV